MCIYILEYVLQRFTTIFTVLASGQNVKDV